MSFFSYVCEIPSQWSDGVLHNSMKKVIFLFFPCVKLFLSSLFLCAWHSVLPSCNYNHITAIIYVGVAIYTITCWIYGDSYSLAMCACDMMQHMQTDTHVSSFWYRTPSQVLNYSVCRMSSVHPKSWLGNEHKSSTTEEKKTPLIKADSRERSRGRPLPDLYDS